MSNFSTGPGPQGQIACGMDLPGQESHSTLNPAARSSAIDDSLKLRVPR